MTIELRAVRRIGVERETDARRRIERVFELGFMPFCQLYQPDETKVYPLDWRQLHRQSSARQHICRELLNPLAPPPRL